jgi:sec-independent protein translocase protein TatA
MEGLLQPTHLFFILLIVLILFGPGKLPELGKGLGKGIREFKDAMRGGMDGSSKKVDERKAEEEKQAEEIKKS